MRFKDKKYSSPGLRKGIGFGLCEQFAREGAIVALNDVNLSLAREAAGRINGQPERERVYAYAGDIAEVEALRTMINRFASRFEGLDVAIANAGITNYGEFLYGTPMRLIP